MTFQQPENPADADCGDPRNDETGAVDDVGGTRCLGACVLALPMCIGILAVVGLPESAAATILMLPVVFSGATALVAFLPLLREPLGGVLDSGRRAGRSRSDPGGSGQRSMETREQG